MLDADFGERVALVTGASGGIGAELALGLAAAGAAVAVHYATNRDPAGRVAETIAVGGGRAATFAADLRDDEAPAQLVAAVEQELGAIDILAANPGLSRPGSYEEIDAAAFDETIAVNLRATSRGSPSTR
ncbi:MAG: SDR family NAD(P)-dependent oxidoreductase [Solirubrobacteraceae bacterium]